jgi:hypothetical protein
MSCTQHITLIEPAPSLPATTPTPTTTNRVSPNTTTATTTPQPSRCQVPKVTEGVAYQIRGSSESGRTVIEVGTTLEYSCKDSTHQLVDGDRLVNCTANGVLVGRVPICVNSKY